MITNLVLPDASITLQDDMWVIMESDNSAITNFKYVVDVYDGNNNLLIRSKVYPNPTNQKGYLNIGSVLRNLPQYNFFKVAGVEYGGFVTPYVQELIYQYNYSIQVGEDFNGVTTTNLAGDANFVYNYRYGLYDRFQFTYQSLLHKFISSRPQKAVIGYNENFFIPIGYGGSMTMALNVYNNSNTLTFNETLSFTYPTDLEITTTGVCQLNLKLDYLFGLFGYTPFPCDEIARYEVIFTMTSEPLTETQQFDFTMDCCPRYDVVLLHFINRFNGFDTARFSLANRLSLDVERKTFQKNDYQFNTDSVTYFNSENVYNESKINYGSKTNWKYKLIMDYPSDAEYEWLAELMDSPQIYAEIDGKFFPVTITNTNYEYSKHSFNGLKQLEVEIEMNQTRFGFRR